MAHVDDLVEPSPEQIVLTAVRTLLRPHRITLPSSKRQQGITAKGADQFARSQPSRPPKPAKAYTSNPSRSPKIRAPSSFSFIDCRPDYISQGFVIRPAFSVSADPFQWRKTIPFNQIGK